MPGKRKFKTEYEIYRFVCKKIHNHILITKAYGLKCSLRVLVGVQKQWLRNRFSGGKRFLNTETIIKPSLNMK